MGTTIFRYPSRVFARTRLLQIAEGMKGRRIVVYGDIVADRFIYGTPKRISREAPVLILRQYRDDVLLGAGGNAINNIHSLGGVPMPVSVLGNDTQRQQLVDSMTSQGIDCAGVVRAGRYNTPTKVRILGGMPHASRQQIADHTPAGRLARPHEIAATVAFLASDDAAYYVGATLGPNGGLVTAV